MVWSGGTGKVMCHWVLEHTLVTSLNLSCLLGEWEKLLLKVEMQNGCKWEPAALKSF